MQTRLKKVLPAILVFALVLSTIMGALPTSAFAEGEELRSNIEPKAAARSGNFPGAELVDSLSVNPTDIQHGGEFRLALEFSGQSQKPNEPRYIKPGTEIFVPIKGDGVAIAELKSKDIPQVKNADITVNEDGIRIRFLDGIQNQYDIEGYVRLVMSGYNDEQDSTHYLTIGNEHKVAVTHRRGGTLGVFADKVGIMRQSDKVTWHLRGNINADNYPGGPLKIHDEIGEGQEFDESSIKINLYWGGQYRPTYIARFKSLKEFLDNPDFGSAKGSKVDYNKQTGEINIVIPEEVLSGKEVEFVYEVKVTDDSLEVFTNYAEFEFHEHGILDRIKETEKVNNINADAGLIGKTRAWININKVVEGTKIPIKGVHFEIERVDGGPLYPNQDIRKTTLVTDEKGEIRAKGFIPGQFKVTEVEAPRGVIIFNPKDGYILDLKANNKDQISVITNKIETIHVDVTKNWKDNNQDEKRPASIEIVLHANDAVKERFTLTANENWQHTFENLPKYDKDGQEIKYTVTETPVEGYTSVVTGDTANGFTITNTITGKVSVAVKKQWVGKPAQSAEIVLHANDAVKERFTLTANENWQHTFKDLPKYDEKGQEIKYTVTETPMEGYNSVVTGNAANGFTVTNTITGKVSVDVTKQWVGKPAQSAEIILHENGREKERFTLTAKDNWQHTFKDLPKYDDKGQEIEYTVTETPMEGYTSVVTGNAANGFTITNTITGKVSVGVTKQWLGTPAQSVEIVLHANDAVKEKITLTAKENWQHTFVDLPKYDEQGQEIEYTVTETPVEGYTSVVTGNAANGFTVTNTITGKVSVGVTKQWIGKPAQSAEVILHENGREKERFTLTAKENWQHTFVNLPKYDEQGQEIEYTVTETPMEGYTSVVTGNAANGFTVTNTITGKVSVAVTKQWVGKPAQSAEVILHENGREKERFTLTANENWQHTFKDLPKYDDKGQEIKYTVTETPMEGYTSEVTGNAANGFTITNTITGKVSIGVTKKWVGPAKDSVVIKLMRGNTEIASQVLNSAMGWKYTFENLDRYDADGNEIQYTITEVEVEGYTSVITKDADGNYTITNTNVPTIPQTGDHSHMMMWWSLLVMSLLGVVALEVFSHKKKRN